MDKKLIIKILQQAKADHIQWIKQAHKVIAGTPRNQIKKPVSCTQCLLGKWYDKEGYKMVNVPKLPILEKLHRDVHTLYTEIYYITFDRRQKARSTILSGNSEIPIDEKQFRQQKLQLLEKKAVTLVRLLNVIENDVSNMEKKVFDSPWLN